MLIRIPYDLIITKEALAKHAESLCTDTSTFHGTEQGVQVSSTISGLTPRVKSQKTPNACESAVLLEAPNPEKIKVGEK